MPQMSKCPQCGYEPPKQKYAYTGYLKPHLAEILKLLRAGKSAGEIAKQIPEIRSPFGSFWYPSHNAMISYIGRRYGIQKPTYKNPKLFPERNRDIFQRHANGETFRSIAKTCKLSPSRVQQIYWHQDRLYRSRHFPR